MILILDDSESWCWKRDSKRSGYHDLHSDIQKSFQHAEHVVVIRNETYEVIKDRLDGLELYNELPLNELPDAIKRYVIEHLKIRDKVNTDE